MIKTLIVAAASLALSQNAYAYLDPATGSIILQGLLAAAAGALITVKLYYYRIKSFFTKSKGKSQDNTQLR